MWMDRRMDRQTDKRTDWNYTNFERNLAMMGIHLPVKFEFDRTNRFRVRVRKGKMWTDVGHINLIGGLVTRNPPKNSIRDAHIPQPGKIFFNTMRYRSSETVHRLGYFHSTACKD